MSNHAPVLDISLKTLPFPASNSWGQMAISTTLARKLHLMTTQEESFHKVFRILIQVEVSW